MLTQESAEILPSVAANVAKLEGASLRIKALRSVADSYVVCDLSDENFR